MKNYWYQILVFKKLVMRKNYFGLFLLCFSFLSYCAIGQTSTYSTAGGPYSYTATGTSLLVTVIGGKGGDNNQYPSGGSWPAHGGYGGKVVCTLAVTPGVTYYIYVGGAGAQGTTSAISAGGINGGGAGGFYSGSYGAGGGGGASDIRTVSGSLASRLVVAGGGGGAGLDCTGYCIGGNGGGTTAQNGEGCDATYTYTGGNGQGGSTTAGLGGNNGSPYIGGNGALGVGGAGYTAVPAGGGGGGFYGGGGAGYWFAAGGGSSYTDPTLATGVAHSAGFNTTGGGQVVITPLCDATGSIAGTTTVCQGATTTLTNPTGASGGTWTSSNTAVGTISTAGVVTGLSPGTTTITYVLGSPCGGTNATATVTVNPVAGAITGTASSCIGASTTLSATPSGGTFSSGTTGVATIGASSGVVTPASTGTTTITYNLGNGCATSTRVYTVNPNPAAVTGTATICQAFTSNLSDATSGGNWSSSNTGVAIVGSSTGVVTGVSGGNPVITYTLPTGCFSVYSMTVNPIAPISGPSGICLGTTAGFSDASTGGTWSSSNSAVASIGTSGIVTGVSLGSATISYTLASTGCSALLTVNVTNTPTVYAVTGGGAYCSGGTGVHIGLNNSNSGISYYLFNGATFIPPVNTGTGSAIDFGAFTASGTYTVVANFGTACATNQSGSATISINPLPTAFFVSGGGAYCSGGSGVNITLNTSTIGINYQLMLGATLIGSPIAGTGGTLTFGPVTSAGTYTVIGTNGTTGCINGMSGSATVSINTLPTSFTVTGGGSFCLGASGVHIGLSNSNTGTTYQLLLGGSSVGSPISGTGSALDFGLITTAGSYTVLATNTATSCSASMSGTVTVVVNSLPTVFNVTGGGSYCFGGAGMAVGLNASTSGVSYQLFNGSSPVGAPLSGTGASLNFGLQTTAGSYTVVATNSTTGCVNNMFGSASIAITPLPTIFNVTGGGSYCTGGAGVVVGLSGSTVGCTYKLFNGATLVGAASGTGGPVSFGLQPGAGTYTVVSTNTTTTCVANMAGSVNVVINPLPTIFTVTGGGNYCSGGTGVLVGLNSSSIGVNYQLFNGSSPVGLVVAGTGSAISFGLQTGAGAYTVVATNSTTTCTNNMSGSVSITVNPLPTPYSITGGGGYCTGGTGVHIGLATSNTGISYQLINSGGPVGAARPGTGSALDFGLITIAGTYSVTATNPSTACNNGMSGSVVVAINTLPTVFTVTGGGNYCSGSTGVHIGLSGSASGTNYQLYNGVTAVGGPVAGTGSPIDFGLFTTTGTYTVSATTGATGCNNNMAGSVSVGINPLPVVFTLTGGGNYCAGGAGVHVGLSGSATGISYQLFNGFAMVGSAVTGTGSSIDFGLETGAGTYSVVATDNTTFCTNNMTGSPTVNVNPLPGLYTITGGGNFCSGGTGMHIGLSGSATANSYQLYNGASPAGSPITGSGLSLDFGLQTAPGTYTISAANIATGCMATMTGTTTIVVNPLPVLHTITGGGNYCIGGTGTAVGLDGSNTGTSYQLYNGAVAMGSPMPGSTGSPINFGLQTGLGIYTVVATNTTTGCVNTMTGSVTIGTYPLPVVFNVTGGGNYCSGGTGVNAGLSGSVAGVNYQLWNGGAPLGTMPGTGLPINFGLQTIAGTYTVKATNATTGCTITMSGSATIGINPLPALHTVTGGGNYCAGGTGVHIGLNGSDMGTNYRLYNTSGPVGSIVAGTGYAIDFGILTLADNYTVIATNTATTCVNTMTGSVAITILPLPAAYTLTGGGDYCTGGTGVDVSLGGSDPGIMYQLYNGGMMIGSALPGSGSILDFGLQTASGTYSVVATSMSTSCIAGMTGSVLVTTDPLPNVFTVTGGGNYCAGGTGVHVMLSGSNSGISYQLWTGGSTAGPALTGTGAALDFGLQLAAGTYTVQATNIATGCVNNMLGSAAVVINPLPAVYGLSSASSNYCTGGAGVDITLSNSDAGINYRLSLSGSPIGSVLAGSGSMIDFGNQLAAGPYTAIATNTVTGCTNTMAGGVSVVINPLPPVFTVTGGGGYCSGGTGVHIGLSGSNSGISYQLNRGGTAVGSPVMGTGGLIDFGLQTITGTYTVVAVNPATTCTSNMSGAASVAVNAVPVAFTVTGGGNYCAGGIGAVAGLSGSSVGVNYQLYKNGSVTGGPVAGTGTLLDFGPQAGTGTYTVVASNAIGGCNTSMTGSVVVGINPAPVAFATIGGGGYCAGGAGVNVGVAGSASGISYQLYRNAIITDAPLAGTGTAINFGLETASGTYTVIATNNTTGCTNNMTGSVVVVINTLPVAYNVVGGGNYCAGGAGLHVGLSSSASGVNYVLYLNSITTVSTLPGTGGPIDFGAQMAAGVYTVRAVNATTGCSSNMYGSVSIVVNPLVTPFVTILSSAGDSICSGTFTTFSASTLHEGTSPIYQWSLNGTVAGSGSTYSYVPSNGDVLSVALTSSELCATPATVNNSKTIRVDASQTPAVSISPNPGTIVCQGSSVTFTASPSFGGTAPVYSWIKNGLSTGVTIPVYSYAPANGDVVYCVMTSNYHCRLTNTASSSHLTMEVDLPGTPVVTISAHPGLNISAGQPETLTATATMGGPSPTYQWSVNGMQVSGATLPTYSSSTFNDGDVVSCDVTSSGGCAGATGTNSVTIHVTGVGVKPVTASGADVKLIPNPNKGIFTVKGSLVPIAIGTDEEVTLEITDMIGQVVYTNKIMTRGGVINQQIELGNAIANGMYILTLNSAGERQVFHLVIEQ